MRYLRALASRLVAVFLGGNPGGLVIARAPGDFADGVEDMETPELAYMRDDDLDWFWLMDQLRTTRHVLAEARLHPRGVRVNARASWAVSAGLLIPAVLRLSAVSSPGASCGGWATPAGQCGWQPPS